MKLTLNIPETLKEITLNQYQQWLKIAEDKEPSLFLQQKMIEIFCGITLNQVMQIKALDIDTITEDIAKVFKEKTRLINRFTLNEIEFGFIPKLDDMSFGEYVDLDNYMSDWQQMHKAMSVLFRPITFKKKNQYLIEDYETAEKYNIKEMTLDIVFGSMVFFLEFKNRIAESYPELFSESGGSSPTTRNESFSIKWGWYSSLYALASNNILNFDKVTKLKIHKCLMQLAFEKDKYELEQSLLKRNK